MSDISRKRRNENILCVRFRFLALTMLQEKGIETYMFERKMDNCKPCGGAIPLCMIDEFKLPDKIVDRKVTTMSGFNQTF